MNRRGSLEWSLETAGKLIFYALILVALIYMTVKMVDLFARGERDWRAKQNFEILADRVELLVGEAGLLSGMDPLPGTDVKRASAIVNLPNLYAIIGFDSEQEELDIHLDKTFTGITTHTEKRPKDCKDHAACLCVIRFYEADSVLATSVLECRSFKARTIGESSGRHSLWLSTVLFFTVDMDAMTDRKADTIERRYVFDALLTGPMGPRSVLITAQNGHVLLDPVCYDSEMKEYPGCKPAPFPT